MVLHDIKKYKKECDGKIDIYRRKNKKTYKSQEVLSLVVEKEGKLKN
jgi:hypothetical protein